MEERGSFIFKLSKTWQGKIFLLDTFEIQVSPKIILFLTFLYIHIYIGGWKKPIWGMA